MLCSFSETYVLVVVLVVRVIFRYEEQYEEAGAAAPKRETIALTAGQTPRGWNSLMGFVFANEVSNVITRR